ncbi:MAG TPA: endonuclease/exonuclease/phosphatase family protein [Kiritimatiellia bacterium]|nr:endonuclease/exonuclease/phosphatase family protein [Kiritimatiellia bacterium]
MKRVLLWSKRSVLAIMDFGWAATALLVCAAWWVGWLVKDRHPTLMWLYFIPTIAVIVFGYFWLIMTLRDRFRVLQLFVFITIFSAFFRIFIIDHRWNDEPRELPENNVRILHWNTAWGVLGVESLVRTMADDEPDIVMISEPPRLDMISDIAYHALGMENIFSDAGMTIASHYPITYLGSIPIQNGAAWHVMVYTDHGPLHFVGVDLISRPNLPRRAPLHALAHWVTTRTNREPLVMVGDFNTPHDSVMFQPLRRHLNHAYEVRGRGWPYTWPVPFPVFAIDHAWVGDDITVNGYHLKTTRFSDHKRQIVDISLP